MPNMYGYGDRGYTEYWRQNRKTRDEVIGTEVQAAHATPAAPAAGALPEGAGPPYDTRSINPNRPAPGRTYRGRPIAPPGRLQPAHGTEGVATVAPSRPEDAGAVAGQPSFKPKTSMKTDTRAKRMAQAGVGTNVPTTITAGTGRPSPTPERVDRDFEARNKTKTPIVEAIRGTDRTFYDPLTDQEYLTKQEALGFPARLTKEDMIDLEKEKGQTDRRKLMEKGATTRQTMSDKAALEKAKVVGPKTAKGPGKLVPREAGVEYMHENTGQAPTVDAVFLAVDEIMQDTRLDDDTRGRQVAAYLKLPRLTGADVLRVLQRYSEEDRNRIAEYLRKHKTER